MTFKELGLTEPILRALADMGYERPSPIQEKAISPALAGRDVLGCAQTGTGKTCAFATPILQELNARRVQGRPIRCLVLTPTRELALQIQESFAAYGKNLPLRSAVIFGGVGQQPQVDKLKAGVDILVATPGRLLDLQGQGFVDLSRLEIFVLDEADRMLDMGFIHDVRRVLKLLPAKKQTLFFSATMPPEVMELVDGLLHDPVKVAVDPISSPVEVIEQSVYLVDKGNKTKLLAQLIRELDVKNALIFTRTKHGANKVAADLQKAGITAAAIHGNKSQTARQQALGDFKAGRIKCLVATDIAARGLDIEELSHVFNYNLPEVPETYVHRIGRTGRAGRGGAAVSFCDFGEQEYLRGIEKLIGKKVPRVDGHPWPMQVFEAPKDAKGRPVNADDAEARQAARERRQARNAAKKAAEPKREAAVAPPSPGPAAPKKQKGGQARAAGGQKVPAAKKRPQTPGEKRQSAGYKASKTLDDALVAMAPRTAAEPETQRRSDAFEAWLAEERAIQAQKFRDDPLAGEEIMDATARLLAPKARTAPVREERPSRSQPKQERRAAQEARNSRTAEQQKRRGRNRGGEGAGQSRPAGAGKAPSEPKASRAPKAEKAPQAPKPSGESQRRSGRDRDRSRGRRGGPPEIILRTGNQKDSTEQPSLMRPYYWTPDE